MADDSARDRVRALVREVLAKAAPEESQTPSRFINTVPESAKAQTVTRDESAKSVITEDDVRGLEAGASAYITKTGLGRAELLTTLERLL